MEAYCVYYWEEGSTVSNSYHMTEQGAQNAASVLVANGLDADYYQIEFEE